MESIAEICNLSIVIPHLRHYLCFNQTKPAWQGYLTQVVASYDDSHFLKGIFNWGRRRRSDR
jgi:hypothetical protein